MSDQKFVYGDPKIWTDNLKILSELANLICKKDYRQLFDNLVRLLEDGEAEFMFTVSLNGDRPLYKLKLVPDISMDLLSYTLLKNAVDEKVLITVLIDFLKKTLSYMKKEPEQYSYFLSRNWIVTLEKIINILSDNAEDVDIKAKLSREHVKATEVEEYVVDVTLVLPAVSLKLADIVTPASINNLRELIKKEIILHLDVILGELIKTLETLKRQD